MKSTPYDDIILLPHHVSDNHPQMPMRDRAAQFAPFAVLTGFKEAVANFLPDQSQTETLEICAPVDKDE